MLTSLEAAPGSAESLLSRHSQRIASTATWALHEELSAFPKPGLVSHIDSGSHSDMNAKLFVSSIASLEEFYGQAAELGTQSASFSKLQRSGIEAERKMLSATGGVNTHRGAIFNMGLLAAAAGFQVSNSGNLRANRLGAVVRTRWSIGIRRSGGHSSLSHGQLARRRYGAGGARAEAAGGFPHIYRVGLPSLQVALARGHSLETAKVQCIFGLIACLPDTNLLHRGGAEGLMFAQAQARRFLGNGGVDAPDWRSRAERIHKEYVRRNLSPGGSADLLAATLFVHRLQREE